MARKVGSFVPSVEQAQMDEILQAAAEDAQEESAPEDAVVVSAVKKGKRPAVDEPEDEEDEEEEEDALPGGEKVKEKVKHPNKRNATSTGRRKIAIEYIPEKAKRTVSFTKRKAGLMKKAFELSTLTKTQCLLVVVSETGLVYTFATKDFKPLVELPVGRRFISRALNQSDPIYDTLDADAPYDDEEDGDEDELEDTLMKVAPTYRQFPLPNHALPPRPAEPFHFVQNTLVENSNYNGYRPPLPDSSLLPFDLHPTPFIPSPLPIQRSLSNEMHHSPPYTSPYAAPPLLLPHQQTPYERASAEHAASFAQYQANAIYAGPKTPIPPPTRSIHGASSFSDDTRALAALHTIGQQSVRTNIEIKADRAPMNLSHATEAISERRAGWVRLAESKLALSKSNPTITNFISSFLNLARSKMTVPPAVGLTGEPVNSPGFPLQGADLTLDLLQQAANESNLVEADRFPEAVQKLLEMSSGSQLAGRRGADNFREHLATFFDHLKTHELISTPAHISLHAMIAPPKTPIPLDLPVEEEIVDEELERKMRVEREMHDWCERARKKYGEELQAGGVEGWFEIYRVRRSYIVLKERDLKGASAVNTLLSPFKVRIPRSLAPALKLDDAIYLTIKQIKANDKTSWIPVRSGSLIPTTDLAGEESDIEPAAYEVEIARLIATTESDPIKIAEKEDKIRFNRLVFEELTRAVEILAQGELSGEE